MLHGALARALGCGIGWGGADYKHLMPQRCQRTDLQSISDWGNLRCDWCREVMEAGNGLAITLGHSRLCHLALSIHSIA